MKKYEFYLSNLKNDDTYGPFEQVDAMVIDVFLKQHNLTTDDVGIFAKEAQ